ncbi:SDR family oxidoreductase [uncultured Ferrovibrio sp.]|jgi:NAD(P)-dependent dehydrogenase (short-subunit alcohol dehydrogenase family)|uniref:SDR family NAD(P)-dependent oxidoreductase n=1 Tax=uncultured Ferrovibrio sp. TaxID=1576913 RepID=UPI002625373A|nr:SDR family oxidoreductase [uncultured Ferrovibrio sp.]
MAKTGDNLFDLSGKVAVITGSSRGIGRSIALRMAQHGAKVVVSSRKADACEKVAQEIREKGGEAIVVPCNVSDKAQLQALVDATIRHWGRIDILVCNAAVNPFFGPMKDIPDDAFDKIMAVNIKSNHWLCNMVAPDMAARRDGAIIIISSVGGLIGTNLIGAYAISKAADMQLARNLAVEWGPHNIRANCIAPGLIRTDFARALWENPDIAKKATHGYALKRVGEPDEIAGAAVFLASRAGSFMTGQTMVIDGGGLVNFQSA